MAHTVTMNRLPVHPGLGRHVNHDSRSRQFAVKTDGLTIQPVKHMRHVPVWDQGNTGSCTGNAALGCLGTGPFYDTVSAAFDADGAQPNWDESMALQVYSQATQLDPWAGSYPPDDTGSDGLSVAKALKNLGFISGFSHGFSVEDALKKMQETPFIFGTNWYDSMFDPEPTGEVKISAATTLAGGHEIAIEEFDGTRVWFTNSWGGSWGLSGRAWLSLPTFTRLVSEDGDTTFFTLRTDPAPTPTPVPDVDADVNRLATTVKTWRKRTAPCIGAKTAQKAVDTFLKGRGV